MALSAETVETPIDSAEPVIAALKSAAPFSELAPGVLEQLAGACALRAYAAGETIYAMGQYDASDALIVHSGKLRASQVDPSTGAMIVEDFIEGDIFGLAAAAADVDPARFAAMSLSAEKDAQVAVLDSEALRAILSQRPTLAKVMMAHFARALLGAGKIASEETTPERRVYAALIKLVERDAVRAEWRIAKMPKHRELAELAGVDEATSAAAIAKLIQSGAARRDYPGLVIDDMASLNRLAH
jgi:CRP-like cAMP-binding protein